MTLIGVGSPKGGVGKSTLAVSLAALIAQHAPHDVHVIDADENASAADWIEGGSDAFPDVWISRAETTRTLRGLRDADLPLGIVDLPGRKGAELRALLTGTTGRPVVDFLLIPTEATRGDTQVVLRTVEEIVKPAGIPYAVLFNKVPPAEVPVARGYISDLAGADVRACATPVRSYTAWRTANNACLPITRVGGAVDRARLAEDDLRAVAREVLPLAGVDIAVPDTDRTPRRRLVPLTAVTTAPEED